MARTSTILVLSVFAVCFLLREAHAQSTEFVYQGQLQASGGPAAGSFDLEFLLYDALSGGNQVGSTLTRSSVTVANGIFSVSLDFGPAFPGADRFLEVHVRQAGGGAYATLSPRQKVTVSPTSINAQQLGGVAANQFVQTNDPRLSDVRQPSSGSPYYIQNQTSQQTADFNISGNGTIAGTLTAHSVSGASASFTLGNFQRAVSGINTSTSGTGVYGEGFVGVSGWSPSNIGVNAVGKPGLYAQASGAGSAAIAASGTSFFSGDTTPLDTGSLGGAFGVEIGSIYNTPNLPNYAYVFAYNWVSNTAGVLALNSPGGNVGIGTTTPSERLTVKTDPSSFGVVQTDGTITVGTYVGGAGNGGYFGTKSNHPLHFFVNNGGPSMSISTGGLVSIASLGGAGSTTLCRNASNQISACSSSLRYKNNIRAFTGGLSFVNKLRPISFDWKADGTKDVGFGAEDVEKIDPRFVTYNEKGQVEGVKYDRIAAVLINAVKEQQAEIEQQRAVNKKLSDEVASLRALVCRSHRKVQVCKK